jgi:hypothetical protein
MAETYITSKKLIEMLKISDDELLKIQAEFDADPNDEWDLQEGKDYKIVIKTSGLREYTQSGAYAIAKYLETHRKESFLDIIKDWFLGTKKKIRQAFIRERIIDNASSLVKRNNYFFIASSDVVAIFQTRPDYLRKMAEEAKRDNSTVLIQGTHYYEDAAGVRYYSLSAIERLSRVFQAKMTKKNRRDFCGDVGEVIEDQVSRIVKIISKNEKAAKSAMDRVKKKYKTCFVTRVSGNAITPVSMAAHHLYSKADYPQLAANEANLVVIAASVHDDFHMAFMGGSSKRCTIDDFIQFVQERYPDNHNVVVKLKQRQATLGNPQPVNPNKPSVLYLPASKVA